MARGFATSLFHFCTRKRTLSTLKALLLGHSHTSSSQFHTLHDSLRPFSTRLLNPGFHPNFSQSSNLSGGRVHSPRPFSTAGDGDEKGNGVAEPEYESDVDFGKNVRFKFGNEIKDAIYALSKNGIVENEGNNECNLKIVDSIESSSRDEPEKKSEQCVHVVSHDPVELYRDLCSAEKGAKLHRSEMEEFKEVCNFFTISGWASNQALAIYIGLSFFPIAAHTFWGFISEKCPADVAKYLVSLGPCDAAVKFLFPIFVEFCLENFRDETERFRVMVESADLTKPHTWFPIARAMKRKIIYHCGPTNSGKTYNALQRFIEAKKGIYCSPLRLLAMDS